MEETALVILNKLKLVDPTINNTFTTFSAYQQSAEIRQLWKSVELSITTIVNIASSSTGTKNQIDVTSSQVISILSASTILSSIIHAMITTQKRSNKSDPRIENIIKKEMQVVLYHIQILKQNLLSNQSQVNAEEPAPQEAIIQHTDILVDSLVAYSLSSSSVTPPFQVLHPSSYKVSSSTSYLRRHSQPAVASALIRNQSSSSTSTTDEMPPANTKKQQYDSYHSLVSSNSSQSSSSMLITKEKTDTVGKKFMRSIQQPFQKNHPVALPSSRTHSSSVTEQPTVLITEQPTIRKHDHRVISEAEEEDLPDPIDDNTSISSFTAADTTTTTINRKKTNTNGTLRFFLNAAGRRKSAGAAVSSGGKRSLTIKDLFQPPKKQQQRQSSTGLVNLFSSSSTTTTTNDQNKNTKKQLASTAVSMQGSSFYSSFSSFSTSLAATESHSTMRKTISNTSSSITGGETLTMSERPSFLISPSAKKTNIQWEAEEDSDNKHIDEEEEDDYDNTTQLIFSSFESYTMTADDASSLEEDSPLSKPKLLTSTPMTRNNSPLPPLPPTTATVENFLLITTLNAPGSPDSSSYFSARSRSSSTSSTTDSSASSSQSTLNSILLDDVTDNLHKTTIEPSFLHPLQQQASKPPIPPPKDNYMQQQHRRSRKDPQQDHSIMSNMNNKQEKKRSSDSGTSSTTRASSFIVASSAEMRISTSDVSSHYYSSTAVAPKSAITEQTKNKRPPIPPRTSSMPSPPPPPPSSTTTPLPPLPADVATKRKPSAAAATTRRSSAKSASDNNEPSAWTYLLGSNKETRAKLGRSLNASTTTSTNKKPKKSIVGDLSDSRTTGKGGKLLKVTENGQVVLLFEMMHGKLQAIAGTQTKLFEKLADETAQDMDYVDTYLMNHTEFISSLELLNLLINRFRLEPSPGELEYFMKWQFSIQTKVLNVLERWISAYYNDFKYDTALQKRLQLFLYHDGLLLGPQFKQQLDKIRSNLKYQQFIKHHNHLSLLLNSHSIPQQQQPTPNFNFHFPFVNSTHTYSSVSIPPINNVHNLRRPSPTATAVNNTERSMFNFSNSPPDSSTVSSPSTFSSLESKDIARYLTLADYYLFKSIITTNQGFASCRKNKEEVDYIELMTKRANMLSPWVVHEICSLSHPKAKRSLLKKYIEIAKLCLELNNFHTCMVITMGLLSCHASLPLKEVWDSLSNRDLNTFTVLQKLLDVSLNMRYYRQKISLVKNSFAIPFLPVVLKDYTFFKENVTWTVTNPNLINFNKFRSISQFVNKTRALVQEPYWFAHDLTKFSFLPASASSAATTTAPTAAINMGGGSLDGVGEWVEDRLLKVQDCYLVCDLLVSK